MWCTNERLKGANREPIFTPLLAGLLNTVLPENIYKDSTKLINQSLKQLQQNSEDVKAINTLLEKI